MERSEVTEKVEANLSGTWYNDLGSEMRIKQSNDASFTGVYFNNAPESSEIPEKLIGSCGNGIPATLGFIVHFEGGQYTTAWSGQYYQNSKDGEVLLTTWLMTANLENAEEYWAATNVGQDRFTRNKPQKRRGRKLQMKL